MVNWFNSWLFSWGHFKCSILNPYSDFSVYKQYLQLIFFILPTSPTANWSFFAVFPVRLETVPWFFATVFISSGFIGLLGWQVVSPVPFIYSRRLYFHGRHQSTFYFRIFQPRILWLYTYQVHSSIIESACRLYIFILVLNPPYHSEYYMYLKDNQVWVQQSCSYCLYPSYNEYLSNSSFTATSPPHNTD